jgi:hypothetical protein
VSTLKLSDWANIAEVVGGVAVVISLIYVGIQINENTAEIRATNRQQLINRSGNATNNAARSPELAGALGKAARGLPLSPQELSQYQYFVRGMQYDVQEAYLLFREGRLDEEYWLTRAAIFQAYMDNESAQDVYRRDKELGVLHGDFTAWADTVVAE